MGQRWGTVGGAKLHKLTAARGASRLATFGVALALFGASCDRQRAPEVELIDCDEQGVAAKCGKLGVPEDRRNVPPSERRGDKLWLSYVVLPAHSARRESPIFFLAGGPGQSAINHTDQLAPLFEELRRERDVVLLDQRGAGKSATHQCKSDSYGPLHVLPLAGIREDCQSELHVDPALYSTDAAADDVEALRVALGYDTIHLVGASYGTRLALRYAERHPGRARSLVLDGVVPPEMRLFLDTLPDTQRALDLVFERCAKTPACHSRHPDLKAEFYSLRQKLHPSITHSSSKRSEFLATIRRLLHSPQGSAHIPQLIAEMQQGRSGGQGTSGSTLGYSENRVATWLTLSVVCAEDIPRFTEAELDQAAQQSFIPKQDLLQLRYLCEKWLPGSAPGARSPWLDERDADYAITRADAGTAAPKDAGAPDAAAAPPSPPSVKLPIPPADPKQPRLDVPALLLSGALDPVTSPRWGELALTRLPRGRHLVVPDAAHGTLQAACVARLMTEFIRSGEAASIDASCLDGREPPPLVMAPRD